MRSLNGPFSGRKVTSFALPAAMIPPLVGKFCAVKNLQVHEQNRAERAEFPLVFFEPDADRRLGHSLIDLRTAPYGGPFACAEPS